MSVANEELWDSHRLPPPPLVAEPLHKHDPLVEMSIANEELWDIVDVRSLGPYLLTTLTSNLREVEYT